MKAKLTLFFFLFFSIYSELGADDTILNINDIIKESSNNNKQVIVFFHMTYCGYCKRMENKTFQDKIVKKLINNNFIFIDINIDHNEKVLFKGITYAKKEFADSLDVDFFPTVVFLDKDSEITYTARGYRKVKKFRKILEYIQTKSFEKIDFFDYYKEE